MHRSIVFAATLALVSASYLPAVGAATFAVNSMLDAQDIVPGDGICKTAAATCTLRAAITEANALPGADVINLPAGVYTTTLVSANDNANLGGDFDITSDISINGVDPATTIVEAASTAGVATERVFHLRFPGPMALNDLTIRHGRYTTSTAGAGVLIDVPGALATFKRVVIADNETISSGGGIAIPSASNSVTTLNGCTVENNSAAGASSSESLGGGIMLGSQTATLNIIDSSVVGNVSLTAAGAAAGGGISSYGILNIVNSVVSDNTAKSVSGSSFGGGIALWALSTTVIMDSHIDDNSSIVSPGGGTGFAGGIYNQGGSLNITNSTISGNTASHLHGGIRNLSSNSAAATVTITSSGISDNSADIGGGGAVNLSVGSLPATFNIIGSTVSGNSANGPSDVGGGVENFSASTGAAVVNITNSTISGNVAANGAGIHSHGNMASINLNFATVAGNTASNDGGGILQAGLGNVFLRNSIVADNAAATGRDISGTVTSQGYNHVENVSGGTFATLSGDVTGSDPQLAPLGNNGGSTLTHLPMPTSPVIDTIPDGTNDCGGAVNTSQTGVARPQLAGCEKGSVEVGGPVIFSDGLEGI